MSNADFWLWTLLFTLISFFICKAFSMCQQTGTYRDKLVYVSLIPDKKVYSIQTNKIDYENI